MEVPDAHAGVLRCGRGWDCKEVVVRDRKPLDDGGVSVGWEGLITRCRTEGGG